MGPGGHRLPRYPVRGPQPARSLHADIRLQIVARQNHQVTPPRVTQDPTDCSRTSMLWTQNAPMRISFEDRNFHQFLCALNFFFHLGESESNLTNLNIIHYYFFNYFKWGKISSTSKLLVVCPIMLASSIAFSKISGDMLIILQICVPKPLNEWIK